MHPFRSCATISVTILVIGIYFPNPIIYLNNPFIIILYTKFIGVFDTMNYIEIRWHNIIGSSALYDCTAHIAVCATATWGCRQWRTARPGRRSCPLVQSHELDPTCGADHSPADAAWLVRDLALERHHTVLMWGAQSVGLPGIDPRTRAWVTMLSTR